MRAPIRIVLVRHGRAAAGWDVHPDPPLDELGRAQADAVADAIGDEPPVAIRTSPMRRCRETAAPLAARWQATPAVDPFVVELPSPDGVAMRDRGAWLRVAIDGRWSDLDGRFARYRRELIDHVATLDSDAVIFSHFVAINALIGAATGDDRMVIARLDNCSRTTFDVVAGELRLVAIGSEGDTLIR